MAKDVNMQGSSIAAARHAAARPAAPVADRRHRAIVVALTALTFLVTFVFFTRVCPLVPCNADDWVLMAKVRSGLPEWGGFNPAKVLPETLLHFINYFAAFCVMPFVGDYVWSIVVAAAILMSGLITAYVSAFRRLLTDRMGVRYGSAAIAAAIFYLCHFVLLSHTNGGQIPFLFGTRDLTNAIHYTTPFLACAAAAFLILRRGAAPEPREGCRETRLSLWTLILLIYLGMFSNLFQNVSLAAFSGACLVVSLAQIGVTQKRKWTVRSFVRHNALHVYVLALWLLSMLFELSGNRATGALDEDDGAGFHLVETVVDVVQTLKLLNRGLLLLLVGAVVATVVVLVVRKAGADQKGAGLRALVVGILASALTLAFIILLSSVISPYTQSLLPAHYYASRSDVLVSAVWPGLALCCAAIAYLVDNWRPADLVAPIAVFLLSVSMVNGIGRYEPPVRGNIGWGVTLVAAQDMVQQVLDADQAGQTSVEVHVLAFHNDFAYNWPLSPGLGSGLADDLYTAGVTSKWMDITIVPDTAVNERLGLSDDIGGSAAAQ